MTEELFRSFFNDDVDTTLFSNLKDDNAFVGLQLIRKYLPTAGIEGAEHDVIYSVDVEEIVNAGISEEDAKTLGALNWHIDEDVDCLACFV